MRDQRDKNKLLDFSLLLFIVFWVGFSGLIETLINWYLEITNDQNNYKLRALIYTLIAIIGLLILYIFFREEDCNKYDWDSYDCDDNSN